MKKKGTLFVLFLSLLLVTSFAFAQEEETIDADKEAVDAAYQCLEDLVGTTCAELTYEAQMFSMLALGDVQDCSIEFLANSENEECWPKGSCKLKDTAIAMIALDRAGEDTTKIKEWLLSQTKVASSLVWYIEIDADEATQCDISYDTSSLSIEINEDKTLEVPSNNCLSPSTGNYWLEISPNCVEKEFTVSCDKDFKTTLLYQTQSSSTIYVSQALHQNVANGFTTEKVTFECFKEGSCNYEGSLWAALALSKDGESITKYLPYLKAFASENRGDFPEAFLHIFTGDPAYLSSTISDNFKGNYWQVGTKNEEYNTALAFMSLGESAIPQVEKAKKYFLNNQDVDGCWNNAKDTGFLLYTGWPKAVSGGTGGGSTGGSGGSTGGTGGPTSDCRSNQGHCTTLSQCAGTILRNYDCINPAQVCCSEQGELETCSQLQGEICDSNEQCFNNNYEDSIDAPNSCCMSTCETIPIGTTDGGEETELCAEKDGTCRNLCGDNEESDSSLSCGEGSGQICCVEKSGSLIWVWVLLILIVVVITLILLRDKIKLLFFRIKSNFRKSPPSGSRPQMLPPQGYVPPPALRPQQYSRPMQRPPVRDPQTKNKDDDFEQTLKKLREMSK